MTHHDTSSKSSQNHHIFPKSSFFPAHLLPPRAPHQQLWLRWRPLAAAEAGLTAARAAGMPVRRPRRPAAVSAADAETDLELSCGALENDRQQIVSLDAARLSSVFVVRAASRLGCSARRLGSAQQRGQLEAARWLGCSSPRRLGSRNQDFFVSALVCVRRSVCGSVSVRLLAQFLRR